VRFDIVITCHRVKLYYTPTDEFVRKSRSVDFKVQNDSKADFVVKPSILFKHGLKGHLGREIAQYRANPVRRIGRSSLLDYPQQFSIWRHGIMVEIEAQDRTGRDRGGEANWEATEISRDAGRFAPGPGRSA
jgi:hypothetical protein